MKIFKTETYIGFSFVSCWGLVSWSLVSWSLVGWSLVSGSLVRLLGSSNGDKCSEDEELK